jgi:integrase
MPVHKKELTAEEENAYSLFLYAVRSPVTRNYYLRRLRTFFNHINLHPRVSMEERCNLFAANGMKDPKWAFQCIVRFLQFQRERVEQGEITGATLRNYVKSIKLFCEMTDIPITWKKITRGLPKCRRFADDRAPTLEEIQRICEYPDRRIKAIVYTMSSSGIRLGAWDYLRWRNIEPVNRDGKIAAARIVVYAGDDEEYVSFVTPEAYFQLENWMEYRKASGEKVDENSWLMRQLWDTKEGRYHHGTIKEPAKLNSSGIKRLLEDALWTQGLRKKSDLKRNRYEFQTNHGFRKWFKTRCEQSGMKSINIETVMGHSIGISDSYYRITQRELLEDYLKAVDLLTIDENSILKRQNAELSDNTDNVVKNEVRKEIQVSTDAIASLADQILRLQEEIEILKNGKR